MGVKGGFEGGGGVLEIVGPFVLALENMFSD